MLLARTLRYYVRILRGSGGGGGIAVRHSFPPITENHKTLADLEVDRKVLKLREVRLPLFIQFRTARRGPLSA